MSLLIHSLSEFDDLFASIYKIINPKHIVEIGSETGSSLSKILEWIAPRNGKISTIDPFPSELVKKLKTQYENELDIYQDKSLNALDKIKIRADAYVLDGDHNYYTVFNELKKIKKLQGDTYFIAILHDIGWPCGRRDQYYNPSDIPKESIHPFTYDQGVTLGNPGVIDGGFRGNGAFATALNEGGHKNGVLTAVEDFIKIYNDFEMINIPAIFGVGILFSKNHPKARELNKHLEFYHNNSLLAKLENNRLNNYLKVIELQDSINPKKVHHI